MRIPDYKSYALSVLLCTACTDKITLDMVYRITEITRWEGNNKTKAAAALVSVIMWDLCPVLDDNATSSVNSTTV